MMTSKPSAELADALERADWPDTSIGNKMLIVAAIDFLRSVPADSVDKAIAWDAVADARREERSRAPAPAGEDAVQESHGSDKEAGWRLDFKWLVQLQTEVEKATGYGATLEVIEETILRTRSPPSVPGVERELSENQRHAIGHAKYLCDRATPDDPEVCFDYELVQTLLALIEQPARDDGREE